MRAALVEPIIGAVSSVMIFNPEWANRGLAWIEAFDNVPLMRSGITCSWC
jgi:hypothetical protein